MNNSNIDLTGIVSFVQTSKKDFGASIAIVHPSVLTSNMRSNLPTNYTQSQTSGVFTLLYGTGYELENLRETLLQTAANNYLYSPDVQKGTFRVNGAGIYLVEFECPFTNPPLDVSISGADTTDVFIESTSNFGMLINVQTDRQDNLQYTASGFVGAATNEVIGDGLYNNFGSLYMFPRVGSSEINNTFVNLYKNTNLFIQVTSIVPAQTVSVNFDENGDLIGSPVLTNNTPPIVNQPVYTGILQPTTVITDPPCTHQLVDASGNLIALLDASTVSQGVSSFYANSGNNIYKTNPEVYVIGLGSTFSFDSWQQPSYVQEVFRADNQYRRILSGINKSLFLGPTIDGISNMLEALIAQPFIPEENWEDSDYRIFRNSIGMETPKYLTYNYGVSGVIESVASDSQYDAYPATPPIVEVKRVIQPWNTDTLTYNTQPNTVSLDIPVTQQITSLNTVTQFDITNELTRQLRLGIDAPTGGIINWNYAAGTSNFPVSGYGLYENYNYVFLNNPGDSITNINIFWFAQQFNSSGPTGYRSFGPLVYGRDYFAVPTSTFLLANGNYDLPSELLTGYACNSNIPYYNGSIDIYGNTKWSGQDLINSEILASNAPALPPFVVQINLLNLSALNVNGVATKMPTNPYDFLLYSYAYVGITQSEVEGVFPAIETFESLGSTSSYYDADTSSALQPEDSPFTTDNLKLSPIALSQSSFAKLVSNTGYEYVTTMLGGNISFNKTVLLDDVMMQDPANLSSSVNTPPGIFIIQALRSVPGAYGTPGRVGNNQYTLTGRVASMISNNGIRYFQPNWGSYVLLDDNGHPIAILDSQSIINLEALVGTIQTITGVVFYTIWDTRIPVEQYRSGSPVFQASVNFSTTVNAFSPDTSIAQYENENFLVIMDGLPLGNQQSVTATWSFKIVPTAYQTTSADAAALTFSDRLVNNQIIYGIMSKFSGINLISDGIDPDNAIYSQDYISPAFNAYFLNYNDYTNVIGSRLSPLGDTHALSTLTNPITTPPLAGAPNLNTVLNFFSPQYGFISFSILPNQEFYMVGSGASVPIVRPNNNGLALQIKGDSYAGLVFYGKTENKIVDKPTRLIADFTYSSANQQPRKKIIEIDDSVSATYVDGKYPDEVQSGSVFYLAGNQFKYVSNGYDQAINQYSSNAPQTQQSAGEYYDRYPTPNNEGVMPPPLFESDPSQNGIVTLPNKMGNPGPPMRYRRPPLVNNTVGSNTTINNYSIQSGYYNSTPEKIAYVQFDFSGFPIDTIVNSAILEIYFASGFTIKQAKNVDMSLNKNSFWNKSRLSGNGKTYLKKYSNADTTTYSLYQPLRNVHWKKNFFEIIIPYAFLSEPTATDFGIMNLFSSAGSNSLPAPQNPQPNLEYLGYLDMDEIDVYSLTNQSNLIENSVGLVSLVLSNNTVIYKINGVLSFNQDEYGNASMANCMDINNGIIYTSTSNCPTILSNASSPSTQSIIGTQINQSDVLPNQKVLVFPFGTSETSVFFYGYVTSVLAPSPIGFDPNSIEVYKKALNYVVPLYSEYVVKLLEADTYMAYTTFGRESTVANTTQDIAY